MTIEQVTTGQLELWNPEPIVFGLNREGRNVESLSAIVCKSPEVCYSNFWLYFSLNFMFGTFALKGHTNRFSGGEEVLKRSSTNSTQVER